MLSDRLWEGARGKAVERGVRKVTLSQSGEVRENCQIGFDDVVNSWPPHLDRHHLARIELRLVDLRDRCCADGHGIEAFVQLLERCAEGRFDDFADRREGEAIVFKRLDTGAAVAVNLNVSAVPGDPSQGERLMAILEDRADDSQRTAFAAAWQDRVRRLLIEFADDPDVIGVTPVQ